MSLLQQLGRIEAAQGPKAARGWMLALSPDQRAALNAEVDQAMAALRELGPVFAEAGHVMAQALRQFADQVGAIAAELEAKLEQDRRR